MQVSESFEILAPAQWIVPAVYNSPHSGNRLPQNLLALSRLGTEALRQSEDCFVDELFSGCESHGSPLLRAHISRAFLDLNRAPDELDPRMFLEDVPAWLNRPSARVAAGLGTIPRIVAEGQEIYRGRIPLQEALGRIETYYRPYHRTLTALLNEAHDAMGIVFLIDCHSMPSSGSPCANGFASRQADIVLGDRFGHACDGELTALVEALFKNQGLHVVRNKPYAGGFITETHGNPRLNRHALQIEINRALYMDERRMEKSQSFPSMKRALEKMMAGVAAFLPQAGDKRYEKRAAE